MKKLGPRRGSREWLQLELQGKLILIAQEASRLARLAGAPFMLLLAFILSGCAGGPKTHDSFGPAPAGIDRELKQMRLADPQWTEDGWQWRDLKRAALLRAEPPVPRPLEVAAQ